MIAFKDRKKAQRLCNMANGLGMRLMVVGVPKGWIITKAKGVNNNG